MKEQSAVSSQQSAEKNSDQVKLPASRKVYVETNGVSSPHVSKGSSSNHHSFNLRVPFREIALSPSKDFNGVLQDNPPVRVYDTSGVWTDPSQKNDVRDGLPALRREWIIARGDVEEYEGREILPQDNGYLTKGAEDVAAKKQPEGWTLNEFPGLKRAPLRAKGNACVTQMHYARKGVITPEMEYVAIRENLGRQAAYDHLTQSERSDRSSLNHQHRGDSFGASIPEFVTPENCRENIPRNTAFTRDVEIADINQ